MASKTGKLFLSGAVVAAVAAGCQAQPLRTGPTLGLEATDTTPYDVLGAKGGKDNRACGGGRDDDRRDGRDRGDRDDDTCLEAPYAVFARSNREHAQMSGSRLRVEGDVHCNQTLKMTGNDVTVTGTGETRDGCFIQGKGNGPARQARSAEKPYPLTVNPDALGQPTFSYNGDVNLNDRREVWAAPGKLKPGIYRASGRLVLSTNGCSGKVTLIAREIQLPGKDHTLEAYAGGVLACATGAALHVTGNGGTYKGLFCAADGQFQMTGHDNCIEGMVMADRVQMDGSVNTIRFKDWGYCRPTASPSPSTRPTVAPSPVASASTAPTPTPVATVAPTEPPAPATPSPTPTPTPVVLPTPVASSSPATPPSATPSPTPTKTPTPSKTPPGGIAP